MRKHTSQLAAAAAVALAIGLAIIRPTATLAAVLSIAVASLLVTSLLRARRDRHRASTGPRPVPGPVESEDGGEQELEGDLREQASRRGSGSRH